MFFNQALAHACLTRFDIHSRNIIYV